MTVSPEGIKGLPFLYIEATKAFVSGISSLNPLSSLPTNLPFFFALTLTKLTVPSANFSICSVPG